MQPNYLLALPREIRDKILGEVIFPWGKEPYSLDPGLDATDRTSKRQIRPYQRFVDNGHDVAVLRTCRQLQHEGETILYETSSFNLMYLEETGSPKLSFEWLQARPRRLRRLIRRVERRCYNEYYEKNISLFDWCAFMKFLATECPNLSSLKFWGPSNTRETPLWVRTCRQDKDWVQAILQIKSLEHFDILAIPGGNIYNHETFKNGFMPWLRDAMTSGPKPTLLSDEPEKYKVSPFRFLDLPREIRDMVYRHIALPHDRRVHPWIGSWYDETTRDAHNASCTCKQLSVEIPNILYRKAIFASELPKYHHPLMTFLEDYYSTARYGPRDQAPIPIRHLALTLSDPLSQLRLLPWLLLQSRLESLELAISSMAIAERMSAEWTELGPQNASANNTQPAIFSRAQLVAIAHIPHVSVKIRPSATTRPIVEPEYLDWLEGGLRGELLKGVAGTELPGMEWLYTPLSDWVEAEAEE